MRIFPSSRIKTFLAFPWPVTSAFWTADVQQDDYYRRGCGEVKRFKRGRKDKYTLFLKKQGGPFYHRRHSTILHIFRIPSDHNIKLPDYDEGFEKWVPLFRRLAIEMVFMRGIWVWESYSAKMDRRDILNWTMDEHSSRLGSIRKIWSTKQKTNLK